jgi:hypothetical protein
MHTMTYAEGREIIKREMQDGSEVNRTNIPESSTRHRVAAWEISSGAVLVLTQIPPHVLNGGVYRYHVYERGEL